MFDSLLGDAQRHLRVPVVCAVALLGVIGVGTIERAPSVEKHLRRDITDSVLVDLPGVRADVNGRDVSLVGSVESVQDREALRSAVARRWGVRTVSVARLQVNLPPPATVAAATGPAIAPTAVSPTTSGSGAAGNATGTTTTPTATSTTALSTLSPLSSALPATTTTSTTPVSTTPVTTTPVTTTPVTTTATVSTTSTATTSTPPPTVQPTSVQQDLVDTSIVEIMVGNPLTFARNAATLAPVSAPVLDRLAQLFTQNPDVAIRIDSYTDNRGRPANNLALSQRRADAVRAALVARGVAATQLLAVGRGETNPIANNATEAGRTLNRRVELSVAR